MDYLIEGIKNTSWPTVFFLLGLIVSLFAVEHARNAWLKPVPNLNFRNGDVLFTRSRDRRYIARVSVVVENSSSLIARIEKIVVNKYVFPSDNLKSTIVSLDEWDIKQVKIFNFGSDLNLVPNCVLDHGKSRTMHINIPLDKHPNKSLKIKVITPNRSFETKILTKEVSIEDFPEAL